MPAIDNERAGQMSRTPTTSRTPNRPEAPDYVRSFADRAAQIGISERTLRRLISNGDGPVVTRLSSQRRGIRDSHWNAWLAAREEPRPSTAA